MRLTVSRSTSGVEGTLAMDDDSCRIVASAVARPIPGLLSCSNAQGVPISFSIDPDERGSRARAGRREVGA